MINIQLFTEKLVKYKISANQLLFCLYIMNDDIINFSLCHNQAFQIQKEEISDLIQKGLLGCSDSANYSFKLLFIKDKFRNEFYDEIEEMAKELYDSYFTTIDVNGKITPARNISFELFVKEYSNIINGSKKEHERILKITKDYVKNRKTGDLGLRKYVDSRFWEHLEQSQSNNLYNIIGVQTLE